MLGLTLAAAIAPGASAGPPPPPANNAFASSIRARPLPFSDAQVTTAATIEGSEQASECVGSPSGTIWYHFRSSTTRALRATTNGSSFDTFIAIWTGSTLATLQERACNDDVQNGDSTLIIETSRVTFRAAANQLYYIQVGGLGETGDVKFQLREVTRPGNDNLGSASAVGGLPMNRTVSNATATVENNEVPGSGTCDPSMATLWFRLSPQTDMVARVDTLGAGIDTVLSVYTGTAFPNFVQGGCNDDTAAAGSDTYASSIAFKARGGRDYYIQLGGYLGQTGSIPLRVRSVTPPANDDWQDAQNISKLPYSSGFTTRNATRQGPESLTSTCGDDDLWHSVWYRFQAGSAPLTATATGAEWTPRIIVYTGATLSSLLEVHCGAGSVGFTPTPGTVYWFRVAGTNGSAGNGTFELETTP